MQEEPDIPERHRHKLPPSNDYSIGTQKVLKGTQTKNANMAYLSPLRAVATGFKSRMLHWFIALRAFILICSPVL